MRLYAWSGQRSAALQQYRDCVRVLEEELGVSPLAETTLLYEDIQNDKVTKWQGDGRQWPLTAGAEERHHQPTPATITPSLFVGRGNELAVMDAFYGQTGPDGRFLVIAGEVGIGKTRLAEQFIATHRDAICLAARCYEGESNLAYAPFVQALRAALLQNRSLETIDPAWLTEAARLLPEFGSRFPHLPAPLPFDWPGAPGRFLEGVSRVLEGVLAGPAPGILWLDDVQWADSASLDLLAFLLRRWRGRPFFILVCWRDAELTADHRLHHLLAESRRAGSGMLLTLTRLTAAAVAELVASTIVDPAQAAAVAGQLYAETEGLPFLVIAYLQVQAGAAGPADTWALPTTARDLFQLRLAQTSETSRQLLQTAAVIGRPFAFELLQAASRRSEDEALLALEDLIGQQLLVEETGTAAYDFSHHKLRQLLYEEMSLVRRRLLHRRVSHVLRGQSRPALAGQIAAHLQAAGMEAKAADYYRQAGDEARALFAHQEALAHYQAALALGYPETAVLHEACGDLHVRLGAYTAALVSYERAAAAAAANALPRLEHKIGQVYYRRGEWNLAENQFAQAEADWQETAAATELARLYIDWSSTAFRANALEQAIERAAKAQALAADATTQAQTHNLLGLLARQQGQLDEALAQFRHSLALAETNELLGVQITALNNLALAEMAVAQMDAAQTHFNAALQRCQTYGDRHWEAALRNNLADLLHQRGEEEAAMAQLKTAVAIYADIGQETGHWQPEIWKLSEW